MRHEGWQNALRASLSHLSHASSLMPLVQRLGACLALAVLAGCGALTPSLFAPTRLAPDVVPASEGSVALVTARAPGRGLTGRVVDRDSGAPLGGVTVTATGADGRDADARTDAAGGFDLDLDGAQVLRADAGCYASLDARPGVGADSSAAVLVLMSPANCEAPAR